MLRKAAVLGVGAVWLAFAFGVGSAHAADPHYTDGTQCAGAFCGVPSNPPPTNPVWASGQECHIDIVDPPSFVFMTEHFVYGTTAPVAGAVPVVDDASLTFPYQGHPPDLFPIDVTAFVAGRRGFRADTWNIGKGVTAWVPFDCTTPETTSTTSTTLTTTTTSTTSTTIASEGSTVSSTSTTLAAAGSTVSTSSTTPVVTAGNSDAPPPRAATKTLPFTGSATWPAAGLGVALVLAGVAAGASRRFGSLGRSR